MCLAYTARHGALYLHIPDGHPSIHAGGAELGALGLITLEDGDLAAGHGLVLVISENGSKSTCICL